MVPLHSRDLSPWSARVIEWSLEPRLGRGWLTGALPSSTTSERSPTSAEPTPVRLNLVIRPEPDRTAWNAFVIEEPRILTFGSTLAEVQARAADAARVWYADVAELDVLPRLQLDPEASRWIDEANEPGCSADQRAEARRQLAMLGFVDLDVQDLLAWPFPLA